MNIFANQKNNALSRFLCKSFTVLNTKISNGNLKTGSNLNYIIKRFLSRGLPKISLKDSSNLPLKQYENAEENKSIIFKENVNKSFVYRWLNKINGKDYLGSTSNAKSRLSTYYNQKSLSLGNMPIYKAILKYGHSNFTFEIIEYCDPKDVIQREQYYLDHFDFDYNILEKADSLLGYKHTLDTLTKMKGRKNALGYKHTLETLAKLKEAQTENKHSEMAMAKMREIWAERKLKTKISSKSVANKIPSKSITLNKKAGKCVIITNIDSNISTTYKSMTEAAIVLNVTRNTLRSYIKNKTVFTLVRSDTTIESNQISSTNIGTIKERYLIKMKEL